MFLPEIYGLEFTVPLASIRDAETVRQFGQDVVRLTFDRTAGHTESFDLVLRDRRGFLDALVHAGRSLSVAGG